MVEATPVVTERHQREALVLSKAMLNAAEFLNVSGNALAEILGVSPSSISRMKTGQYVLSRSEKAFELAALFVRLFRGIYAITGGDQQSSRSWLANENTALHGRPSELIRTISGLNQVLMYVDSRRAKT